MQLIIFDTEFTAWPGSVERHWSHSWEHRELIQLAAVKVTVGSGKQVEVTSSFNEIIKPVKNPRLSDYIMSLTDISQSVIDEMGVDFSSALSLFHQFCDCGALPCYAWGRDAKILQENCDLYSTDMPDFKSGFFNLNQIARQAGIEQAQLCSGELANDLGLPLQGHNHNALYDVRSIAMALGYWFANGHLSPQDLAL